MLLGFYDRNGDGLAVELSPEMAKAIASRVVDVFATVKSFTCLDSAGEIRLMEFDLGEVYQAQDSALDSELTDEFFEPTTSFRYANSGNIWSTGIWIDVRWKELDREPSVFWEFDSPNHSRECTPSLSLTQLKAIAQNQPLPQGNE